MKPTFDKHRTAILAVLLALGAPASFGQTARIAGRVTDPTGNVVPEASVAVVNLDTGVKRAATSNEVGYYTVPVLPPGNYQITAIKDGFRPVSRTGIRLLADDKVRIDFALELGAVAETITVTADVPQLRIDSPELGASITSREYDHLPLVQINRMRNPSNFIYLTPGVHGNLNTDGNEWTGATNQIQIHGSQRLTTEVLLDGMTAGLSGNVGSFTESAPPVDAIQEFKVQSSQISAEYGHTGSGVVNFTVKSGTNALHGSAFEYLRNHNLDARNWFAPTRALTHQNEFGFSLGGPVLLPKVYDGRDRTFFFFAFDGSRKRGIENVSWLRVPTREEIAGDFRGNVDAKGDPVPIFDPLTTRSDGKGGFIRDPFSQNTVPSSRIDPVAAKVLPYAPTSNASGGAGLNYMGLVGEKLLDPTTVTTKVDHTISPRQRIWSTFNWNTIPRLTLYTPLPEPFGRAEFQEVTTRTVRLTHDYSVRPSVLNEVALGYNRMRNPMISTTYGQQWPEKLGLRGVPGSAFPALSIEGYSSFGNQNVADNVEQTYILKDSMTLMAGRHVFKAGVEHRRTQENNRTLANMTGTYNFSTLETALPSSPASSGNGWASFLLGAVHSGSLSFQAASGPRRPYYGFFVQDDFKASSKLTLNLGFRFEFEQAPYEAADRQSALDLDTPNPKAGNLLGALVFAGSGPGRIGRRALVDTDYSAFGPRFGLAWHVQPRTVVRAGYGIYYSANYLSIAGTTGFNIGASFSSLDNGITPAFRLADGFPQNFPRELNLDPTRANGQGGSYYEATSGRMPRTQNWSFGIQHQLSSNVLFEAAYIANHSTRQVGTQLVTTNQLDPKFLALGQLLTKPADSAEARQAGITIPYPGFIGSVAQALRPYPQYTGVSPLAPKAASCLYHGMELRLTKRLSYGLSVDGHYILSKNIGHFGFARPGYFGFDIRNLGQDTFNRRLERSIVSTDVTHALVLYYIYEVPLGAGKAVLNKRGFADKIVGGWTLSGMHRYQSGTPLQILMNNTLPIFNQVLRPDRVLGQSPSTGISNARFDPTRDRVINVQAFAAPAPFRFGTAAPTIQDLRNFPVLSEDLSLTKRAVVREGISMEMYGQFVNALNRHRFTSVDTNFSSRSFGKVRQASLPRYIQLGLRVRF